MKKEKEKHSVYLLLGSNLGNRVGFLKSAILKITRAVGEVREESKCYESSPWGFEHSKLFLNKVIVVETEFSPEEVLALTQRIETELGRIRNKASGYGPRTIDVDILFYDDIILDLPQLKIPHPLLRERRFTMLPMNEIAPEFIDPVSKKTIRELLKKCKDKSDVTIYTGDS